MVIHGRHVTCTWQACLSRVRGRQVTCTWQAGHVYVAKGCSFAQMVLPRAAGLGLLRDLSRL